MPEPKSRREINVTRPRVVRPKNELPLDIGDDIDDTWALVMLLKSPGLDLKLVTTTCGKAEYRARIIAKLLTMAGRDDIPIGLGEGGHDGGGPQDLWVKDYKLGDYRGKVILLDFWNHS